MIISKARNLSLFVFCCLVLYLLPLNGCGQTSNQATTTSTTSGSTSSTVSTTTTTTSSITTTTISSVKRSNCLAISAYNGCKTYGGSRAASIAGVKEYSTYTVTGYIYHALTGAAISGATITCGSLIATSDASGYYSLENVPSGKQVFAALAPAIANGYPYYTAVATDAKNIDFYICYLGNYFAMPSAGSVKIMSFASTWMAYLSSTTGEIYSSLSGITSGPTDLGTLDVSSIAVGPFYASAGSAALGNGFNATYLNQNYSTTLVTVEIPSSQGAVQGSITVPSYFQNWTVSSQSPVWFAVADNKYAYSAYWSCTNNQYSVPVPAGQQFLLALGIVSNEGYSLTYAGYGLSVEAGETESHNIAFQYDMVKNIQISSMESGGTLYTTITWEAPTLFTPDLYMIVGSGITFGSFIYTQDTAITVPFGVRDSEYTTIFALKAQETVDINSINMFSVYLNGYSYRKARVGGG